MIFNGGGTVCNSYVGNNNGFLPQLGYVGQNINLGSDCFNNNGTIQHEMGHAVGLWHEQQRCDRDNFVIVNSSDDVSYGKRCGSDANQYGLYDYSSVMHTGQSSTILQIKPNPISGTYRGIPYFAGLRSGLSQYDIDSINAMYYL